MKVINNDTNKVDKNNSAGDGSLNVLYFVIFGLSVIVVIAVSIIIYLLWTNKKKESKTVDETMRAIEMSDENNKNQDDNNLGNEIDIVETANRMSTSTGADTDVDGQHTPQQNDQIIIYGV